MRLLIAFLLPWLTFFHHWPASDGDFLSGVTDNAAGLDTGNNMGCVCAFAV